MLDLHSVRDSSGSTVRVCGGGPAQEVKMLSWPAGDEAGYTVTSCALKYGGIASVHSSPDGALVVSGGWDAKLQLSRCGCLLMPVGV